jgi:hypothetical protein
VRQPEPIARYGQVPRPARNRPARCYYWTMKSNSPWYCWKIWT